MITIKKSTPKDIQAIYQMICELEACYFDEIRFHEKFLAALGNPNLYYLTATNGSAYLGFISLCISQPLHHERPIGEIQELFVKAEARTLGIGKRLVEAALDIAKEQHLETLEVTTRTNRDQAIKFYLNNGFIQSHYKFCHFI